MVLYPALRQQTNGRVARQAIFFDKRVNLPKIGSHLSMADPEFPQPGAQAPSFTFLDADGGEWKTTALAGKAFVVYFYPRDDTPGCTKEACGFRDAHADFARQGVTVIGVSPDDDDSHRKFRQKHDLPFGLAADTSHAIARAYGAWGPKKFMGREYEGVRRISFLVDSQGRIAKIYPKVKPTEHAREILADLKNME